MANILEQLADHAAERVAEAKKLISPKEMKEQALLLAAQDAQPFRFEKALTGPGISFICEIKQASPSRGQIWQPDSTSGTFSMRAKWILAASALLTLPVICMPLKSAPIYFPVSLLNFL